MTIAPRNSSWVSKLLLASLVALLGNRPFEARAAVFDWAAAVSGLANDPSRWNPNGIPGAADRADYNVPGAYTVTFPAAITAVDIHNVFDGNVTFRFDSPSTCTKFRVGDLFGSILATIEQGTLVADEIQVGDIGAANSTLTLVGSFTHVTGSGRIGLEDTATLNVSGGAQMVVGAANFQIASSPGSNGTWNISGRDAMNLTHSHVEIPANAASPLVVGRVGTGTLAITSGGSMDADCDIHVGTGSSSHGIVDIGPRGVLAGATYLRARRKLLLGGNDTPASPGSDGLLSIHSGAFLETAGRIEVGDPDGSVAGRKGLLRLYEGSRLTATGGLKFWPTPAALDQPLALYGGVLHVRSGAFEWPASKVLYVSSQVGTPTLWIANGVSNIGPSTSAGTAQMFLARSGAGELRVTQPGTDFLFGAGSTTVADSATGHGSIVVDSTGSLRGTGPLSVGVRGAGSLTVMRQGFCDTGTLSLGTSAGGAGVATVIGSGSRLRTRDNLWLGGGLGGAGGSGSVVADSSALVEVISSGGVNPPLLTLYAGGSAIVANGARILSPGSISNAGQLELRRGTCDVLSLTQQAAGRLRGWGTVTRTSGTTNLNNSGEIAPFGAADAFGAIDVAGNLNLFAASHFRVDLGRLGGRHADTLRVTGTATLNGALDLTLDPTFVRVPGDTFTVLTCGARSGTFSAVTWNGVPLGGQAQVVYETGRVRVLITNTTVGTEDAPLPVAIRLAAGGGPSALAFTLDLPHAADVDVRLHDVAGRELAVLARGALAAGRHRFAANAVRGVDRSGVYFARARITANATTHVRSAKAALIR